MHCKMDVDDAFRADPADYRRLGCDCAVDPVAPATDAGCACPSCGSSCRECPGFGFATPPEKRFFEIISRVRALTRRRVRARGQVPGYVRLLPSEVRVLVRKVRSESPGHWVGEYVDLGPPIKVFDMIIIPDWRRK